MLTKLSKLTTTVCLLVAGMMVAPQSARAAGGLSAIRTTPRPLDWRLIESPLPAGTHEMTDTVPGDNTIIDLIFDSPDLWVGTGSGVSRRSFPSESWTTWTEDDGLGSNEIPALGVFRSGVWAATSHSEVVEDASVPWGDGLFIYEPSSESWLDRSPVYDLSGGGQARQTSGPFMLCFDIAEFRDGLVGACFAGGLILTPDAGQTWKTIFADNIARVDFENQLFTDLNNRFFSVAVDETVADSVTIYAGSAWGINKYVYLDSSLKVTGHDFADLTYDGTTLYAASLGGVAVTPNKGASWRSFYENDGLPTDNVTAVAASGDTIWLGFASDDGEEGRGIAWSTDNGASWIVPVIQPSEVVGPGHVPQQIVIADGEVWIACNQGGVLHASDLAGTSLSGRFSDLTVNAILTQSDENDTLYLGTLNGIVRTTTADAFRDNISVGVGLDGLSQRVKRLAWQDLPCVDGEPRVLWALVGPLDTDSTTNSFNGWATSGDRGASWTASSRRMPVNDVAFFGCKYYLASDSGLAEGNFQNLDSVIFSPSFNSLINAGRAGRQVRSLEAVIGKTSTGADSLATLWVGTDTTLAFTTNTGTVWGVVFSNPDPLEFDLIFNYHNLGLDSNGAWIQLSGNFITALGLQEAGGKPVVWAATRGTGQGRFTRDFIGRANYDGISYSRDGGVTWIVPDLDSLFGMSFFVWNFAFDGNVVWAAASQGLLFSPDGGTTWTLTRNFTDPQSGAIVDSTVEILGVAVVDDEVWVGTENGLVVLSETAPLTYEVARIIRSFRKVDPAAPGGEGGAYATPVPFSPVFARTNGGLRLHYVPPVSGDVTITIYDFANNVVRTLLSGEHREADRQYDETDIWDGRNGDGDPVAVGTYFFVIEYSDGTVHWGKIAVIP